MKKKQKVLEEDFQNQVPAEGMQRASNMPVGLFEPYCG